MQYHLTASDTEAEIFLEGSVTFADHVDFKELINKLQRAEGVTSCYLDLKSVQAIDSAGLGMLIILKEELQKQSKSVTLRHPVGQVAQMLKVADFDKKFSIYW